MSKMTKLFTTMTVALPLLFMLTIPVNAEDYKATPIIEDDTYLYFRPFGAECGGGSIGGGSGSGANLIRNGWLHINGNSYFYVNNQRAINWLQISGHWHFFNTNGRMQRDWGQVRVSNSNSERDWFFFGTDGRMRTGWARVRVSNTSTAEDWFFFGNNGRMRVGWREVVRSNTNSALSWFYFGTNGRMRTGFRRVRISNSSSTEDLFYFGSNGRMHTGFQTIAGNSHFFHETSGRMQTAWLQRGANWYFLNPPSGTSGHTTNRPVGARLTGWLQRGNNRYFLHETNGRMQTGWVRHGSHYYFLNPALGTSGHNQNRPHGVMLTGWLQRGSDRYFLHETNGRMQTGWLRQGNIYFFLNPALGVSGHNKERPHGVMLTGWLQRGSNRYFLHTSSGRMLTGWHQYGGNHYFLNPAAGVDGHSSLFTHGAMRTGWVRADRDHQFFMNNSGRMQVGWVNVSGHYYFLNPARSDHRHDPVVPHGAMRTGRVRIYDRWHQFNASGIWQGRASGRDPGVHLTRWWPPANSGETVIPIRRWSSPDSNWVIGMNRALSDWHNNNTNVRFILVESSSNPVYIDFFPPTYTWFGAVRRLPNNGSGGIVNQFRVRMNRTRIYSSTRDSQQQMRNYVTSVFAHELSHVVGLEDNPTGAPGRNDSLMNSDTHSRDRNVITELTPFDIANVNLLY